MVLIIGIIIGNRIKTGTPLDKNLLSLKHHKQTNKLTNILNYIRLDYVDSVDENKLTTSAIKAMIRNLDPHTQYISRERFAAVHDQLMGSFEGIGVYFSILRDTLMVIRPQTGGPSDKVGIKGGDRIVKVNDTTIANIGIDDEEAKAKLKGPRGSTVKITVKRLGTPQLLDFEVKRDIIPTSSMNLAYMVNDSIGYIKLNTFSATTYEEFRAGLEKLKEDGLQELIIDLRGNEGGYVRQAINIADELLSENLLIVYTKGNNRPKATSYSTNRGIFEEGDIVILMDERSASASEILAGAIQDNDRGVIIGRRSFGKGLVQEQLNLSDGSAFRMTIARYYTPTGRSIQKPYKGEDFNKYYSESYHRFANGELTSIDSVKVNDSLKYTTPKGKIVYGGGGIMPDKFVAVETSTSRFYQNLMRKQIIYQFAFYYLDRNRKKIEKFKNVKSFIQNFKINHNIIDELIVFIKEQNIEFNKTEYKKEEERIKVLLKAQISNNLFDDEGFFPVYHQIDKTFKEAVNYLTAN